MNTPTKVTTRRRRRKRVDLFTLSMVINGFAIDYTREEFDDRSFKETGLPEGMQPRPTVTQLIEHAWSKAPPALTMMDLKRLAGG